MNKNYKSEHFGAVHETISDVQKEGLDDKRMTRRYDEACFIPITELSPEDIKS